MTKKQKIKIIKFLKGWFSINNQRKNILQIFVVGILVIALFFLSGIKAEAVTPVSCNAVKLVITTHQYISDNAFYDSSLVDVFIVKEEHENKIRQARQEETLKQQQEKQDKLNNLTYLGNFKITYYCTGSCCCGKSDGITASGRKAVPYYTVAVDRRKIPLNCIVVINGKEYRADDTGGAIKGNRIDICVGSHSEALKNGVKYMDVYIKK